MLIKARSMLTMSAENYKWVAPPRDFLKSNSSGSVKNQVGTSAYLIRDHDSEWVVAEFNPNPSKTNSRASEMTGMANSLRKFIELKNINSPLRKKLGDKQCASIDRVKGVIIESDNIAVVESINGNFNFTSDLENKAFKLRELVKKVKELYGTCIVRQIKSEVNGVAQILSRMALNRDRTTLAKMGLDRDKTFINIGELQKDFQQPVAERMELDKEGFEYPPGTKAKTKVMKW